MKLVDTINLMDSSDFKDRFKAEYFQLDNRINGLNNMLANYRRGTLGFTPKCNLKLLDSQLNCMIQYRTHLVERARIEHIDITEPVEVMGELTVDEDDTVDAE